MIRFKRMSEIQDMKVFVENGDYFGEIEGAQLTMRKLSAWKIRATKNSILEKVFRTGGQSGKGVIVPHNLIKAIGDIMIISKGAIPSYPDDQDGE